MEIQRKYRIIIICISLIVMIINLIMSIDDKVLIDIVMNSITISALIGLFFVPAITAPDFQEFIVKYRIPIGLLSIIMFLPIVIQGYKSGNWMGLIGASISSLMILLVIISFVLPFFFKKKN